MSLDGATPERTLRLHTEHLWLREDLYPFIVSLYDFRESLYQCRVSLDHSMEITWRFQGEPPRLQDKSPLQHDKHQRLQCELLDRQTVKIVKNWLSMPLKSKFSDNNNFLQHRERYPSMSSTDESVTCTSVNFFYRKSLVLIKRFNFVNSWMQHFR